MISKNNKKKELKNARIMKNFFNDKIFNRQNPLSLLDEHFYRFLNEKNVQNECFYAAFNQALLNSNLTKSELMKLFPGPHYF